METVTITLTSEDLSVLDVSVGKTLRLLPFGKTHVTLLPTFADTVQVFARKIFAINVTKDEVALLQKLDLPDVVHTKVRIGE